MTLQLRGRASMPFMIQTRSVTTDSETGQPIETWSDAGLVFASIENHGGIAKGEFEDTLQAMERKVAVIDYRADVVWSVKDTRLQSVEDAGLVYSITEITDPGGRHHVIEFTLEEVVT